MGRGRAKEQGRARHGSVEGNDPEVVHMQVDGCLALGDGDHPLHVYEPHPVVDPWGLDELADLLSLP